MSHRSLFYLAFLVVACSESNDKAATDSNGGGAGNSSTDGGRGTDGGSSGGEAISINANGGQGGHSGGKTGTGNVCDSLKLATSSIPPRVVFVQDLSSSMTGQWQPLDDAMVSIANKFGARLQLGLIPFSSIYLDHADEIRAKYATGGSSADAWFDNFFSTNDNDCNISDSSIIIPSLGNTDAVVEVYDSVIEERMVGGTPTYLAMRKTHEVLVDRDPGDGSSAYAILVTDGEPNCDSPTGDLIADVETAITALAADGVNTYVVGYQYDGKDLDSWAAAGNTTKYYDTTNTDDLNTAISAILSGLAPCEYTLSAPVEDAKFVRVTIDKKDRALNTATDGWKLSADKTTVILTGKACTDLRSSGTHTVDVVVECDEVTVLL